MSEERQERCDRCRFWEKEQLPAGPDEYGLCRRFPPKHSSDDSTVSDFPCTDPDDWCGEFQSASENKRPMSVAEMQAFMNSLDAASLRARIDELDKERIVVMKLLHTARAKERRDGD